MSAHRRLRIALAGLALVGVGMGAHAAFAIGDRPAPGQYRVTTVITGEKPKMREECLSASDIAEAFTLPKGAGQCTVARNTAAGGRIDLAQSCTSGKRATSGAISGTYTANGYQVRIQSRAPELPQPLDLRMTAQRIGTCSPD